MKKDESILIDDNSVFEKKQEINIVSIFPELNDSIKTDYSLFKFGYKKILERFSQYLIDHLSSYKKDEILILAPSLKESSAIKFLIQKLLSHFQIMIMKGQSANMIDIPYSSLSKEERSQKREALNYSLEGEVENINTIKKVFLLDDSVVTGKTLDILRQLFEKIMENPNSFEYEKLCLIAIDPNNASDEHIINRFCLENNHDTFIQLYKNNPEDFNYTNYLIRFLKTTEGHDIIASKTSEFQKKVVTVLSQFQ